MNLGNTYDRGEGVRKSPKKGFERTLEAAEGGEVGAQFDLGLSYLHGEGVDQDPKEALTWFRRAARGGHVRAMFEIGEMYCFGEGVRKSYRTAFRWYSRAVEFGDEDALCALGVPLLTLIATPWAGPPTRNSFRTLRPFMPGHAVLRGVQGQGV